jgi:hypothetical protein
MTDESRWWPLAFMCSGRRNHPTRLVPLASRSKLGTFGSCADDPASEESMLEARRDE